MSFFSSELVRAELAEISELQESIYTNVFKFPSMPNDEKIEHVDMLEKLLDKQRVLYTRLSLSDDPEAIEMKNQIAQSALMMGLPENVDMNLIFNNMGKMLELMKKHIDNSSTDL